MKKVVGQLREYKEKQKGKKKGKTKEKDLEPNSKIGKKIGTQSSSVKYILLLLFPLF